MKKFFIVLIALSSCCFFAHAQQSDVVVQDSNDLFYNIIDYRLPGVEVTYPNKEQSDLWKGYPLPCGHILFPGTIFANDRTYEVSEIAPWTFFNCTGIVEVSLTDHLLVIGFSTFAFCDGLTHIELPASLREIGGCAFLGCHNLTHITVPARVKEIKPHTFADCPVLATVSLPDSLIEIGRSAFDRSGITAITIPASVNLIGRYAFRNCQSLHSIKVTAAVPPQVSPDAFDGISPDCILYIPDASRTAYQEAEGWKQFTHMEEY